MILLLLGLFFIVAPLLGTELFDKPGVYIVGSDLAYDPTQTDDAIIMITGSNITLDLNLHNLYQMEGNTQPGLNAIVVASSANNVTIKNGSLGGVTGVGLYISDGCSNIYLQDLTVQDCDVTGILYNGQVTGISSCTMKRCSINSCKGSGGSPAYGLRMIKGNKILLEDNFFGQNDALTTSSGYGVSIEYSQGIEIAGAKVAGTGGNDLAVGVYMYQSNNILLSNVLVFGSNTHSMNPTALSYGFLSESCSLTWKYKCEAITNSCSSGGAIGFASHNGSKNLVESSFAQTNLGYSYGAGIELINESKSYITNCRSRGNKSLATGNGYGIRLTSGCDRCYIEENTLINNSGAIASYGLIDETIPSTCAIVGNYAFNNGINYSVTYTGGVVLPEIDGSLSGPPGMPTTAFSNLDNVSIMP